MHKGLYEFEITQIILTALIFAYNHCVKRTQLKYKIFLSCVQ